MNRWLKRTLICLLCLVLLSVLGIALLFWIWVGAMGLAQDGIWPFPPLEAYHHETKLENGGMLIIDGKEWREFSGKGFDGTVSYLPSGSTISERIGTWHKEDVRAYTSGQFVVVVGTEGALHVRLKKGNSPYWKDLKITFPSKLTQGPISFAAYSERTGISEESIKQIWADLDEQEKNWFPVVSFEKFDQQKREFIFNYDAGPTITRRLHLSLADEGTRLNLTEMEKIHNR